MSKLWLVFWHEVTNLTARRSFWIGVFGPPLVTAVVTLAIGWINSNSSGPQLGDVVSGLMGPDPARAALPLGVVDESGLLEDIPTELESELVRFSEDADARLALTQAEIRGYYRITADYLRSGRVYFISTEGFLLEEGYSPADLRRVLAYSLLDADRSLLQRLEQPWNLEEIALDPDAGVDRLDAASFFIPYGLGLLLYITILGTAALLLSGLNDEYKNRIMEVLITSLTPHQLLAGKLLGLGVMGLFNNAVWAISAGLWLAFGGREFEFSVQISAGTVVWMVVYYILGYLLYASLAAGLGALLPNLRETSQITLLIMFPLLMPIMFSQALVLDTKSPAAMFFSLFPLTSPVGMLLRQVIVDVPLGEHLLAVGLLVVSIAAALWLAARTFLAQRLLSGQGFKPGMFFKTLFSRARG